MLENGFRYIKTIDSLSLILVKGAANNSTTNTAEEATAKGGEEERGGEPANKRRRTTLSVSESAGSITNSFQTASDAFGYVNKERLE